MENEILFNKATIDEVIRSNYQEIEENINSLTSSALSGDTSSIVENLYKKYSLEAPKLIGTPKLKVTENVDIETGNRGDWGYGRHTVKGSVWSFQIDYEGDRNLFDVCPNNYLQTTIFGEIKDREKKIYYHFPKLNEQPEEIKRQFENNLQGLNYFLNSLQQESKSYNDTLKDFIQKRIEEKKVKVNKDLDQAKSLGYDVVE
ncbi:MAG: hypothetical protein L0Y77_11805 [Chlorobi bacterium]|nr:hypothetical protein [Chlorobiota bacterium]